MDVTKALQRTTHFEQIVDQLRDLLHKKNRTHQHIQRIKNHYQSLKDDIAIEIQQSISDTSKFCKDQYLPFLRSIETDLDTESIASDPHDSDWSADLARVASNINHWKFKFQEQLNRKF